MSVANHFHFIGVCYGEAKIFKTKKGLVISEFVIQIDEKSYIPLVAYGLEAERTTYKCRTGNKLAVSGKVVTKEKVDIKTGQLVMKIWFVTKEVMLLTMPKKRVISEKKISDITDLYCPEEHETLIAREEEKNDTSKT